MRNRALGWDRSLRHARRSRTIGPQLTSSALRTRTTMSTRPIRSASPRAVPRTFSPPDAAC